MAAKLQAHAEKMDTGIQKHKDEIEQFHQKIADKHTERTQALAVSDKLKALLGN